MIARYRGFGIVDHDGRYVEVFDPFHPSEPATRIRVHNGNTGEALARAKSWVDGCCQGEADRVEREAQQKTQP